MSEMQDFCAWLSRQGVAGIAEPTTRVPEPFPVVVRTLTADHVPSGMNVTQRIGPDYFIGTCVSGEALDCARMDRRNVRTVIIVQ